MVARRVLSAAVAVWLVWAAGAARAAEDVLKAIPDDALAFAAFHNLAETDAAILKMAGQLKLPPTSPLTLLKEAAGVKQGIDEKGTAALVLLAPEEKGDEPVAVLLVPVTDYAALLKQLKPEDATAKVAKVTVFDSPLLCGRRGAFAVLGQRGLEKRLAQVLDAPKSVAEQVSVLQGWPGDNQVTGVLTRKGIEFLSDKALEEIRKAKKEFGAMAHDENMKEAMGSVVAVFEFYEKTLEAFRKEAALAAGGLRVDAQGNLLAEGRLRLVEEGRFTKALADVKPVGRNLLAGLPNEPYMIAMAGAVPTGLTESMIEFSMQLIRNNPVMFGMQPEDMKKYIEVSKDTMRQLKGMAMVMGVGKGRDPLYANTVGLFSVDDAPAYVDAYFKGMSEAAKLAKDPKSLLAGVKTEKEKIGDAQAIKVSMKVPLPATPGADMPEVKKAMEEMMEKMYGPGGEVVTHLAVADRHTVVMGYTTTEPAAKTIRAVKAGEKGLAGDAGIAKTAAMLPADAAWVLYWSPKGTMEFVERMIKLMAGDAPVPIEIPAFPATPPIGVSLGTTPNEVRAHVAVPIETLKAGSGYVQKIVEEIGGGF